MKKIILLSLIFATSVVFAQRPAYHNAPDKYFNEGKEMFHSGNYVGAYDLLTRYMHENRAAQWQEDAEYMIAASSYYRGMETAGTQLKTFLDTHPETVYRHQLNFLIGSYHFNKKEWKLAEFWFAKSNIDYLSSSEQEDYSFRMAYTQLQSENFPEAQRLFGLLFQNSTKYRNAADFYLGYMEYKQGDFENALYRFNRLKADPTYQEDAAFYAMQSTFFKGQLEQAVRLSQAFLEKYPQSEHTTEVNRIIGNSYYRLERPKNALLYYEKYMAGIDKPLRGDAYFMGLSYAETGKNEEAIRMFQHAIGVEDALSQNAQLQLGHAYLKTGDKQKAQMSFEAASRTHFDAKASENALFNYALLVHETNFSVFSESISLFEKFLREYPKSSHTHQVNDILAETFLSSKNYDAALAAINRIPNPANRILEAKQMVLFQLGAQQFIDGNLNEAITYFNNSIGVGEYDMQARSNALYWRGECYYRIANYANAESDFQNFTRSASSGNENYAMGWYNLGYAQFKQQKYAQSLNAFQQYVSVENNKNRAEYADALNRIGDAHYFNRDFEQAESRYAQAAQSHASAADYAMYQQAFVMGLQRNFDGKIAALDNLMRRYPSSSYFDDALYEKSRALTMLGREQDAISVLNTLITDYPKSSLASEAGIQLGQLYYNLNSFDRSIEAYKSVITNFPGTDDARTALISMETVYRDKNDVASYINYTNSLPQDMRISPTRQDSLSFLAAEGVYMKGSKADAETAMVRYLENYPNGVYSSDANYYLANLMDARGNKAQAKAYYRKVINANNPKYTDNALLYVSNDSYNNGDYRAAVADYSKLANVARASANRIAGKLGVVRSQYKLASYTETVRSATELLKEANLSPETSTEARYLRAKSYLQSKETEKATADLQSLATDTRNVYGAEAQFLLADMYYRWKSYDKAESQVKTFMQKGTPHGYWLARALIVLADTYTAKGDSFQAKQYLQSLKSNYKGKEADIQQMISERLK